MSTAEHAQQHRGGEIKEKNVMAEAGKTIMSTIDIGSDLLRNLLSDVTAVSGKGTMSEDILQKVKSVADRLEYRSKKLNEYYSEFTSGRPIPGISMDELKALCSELNNEIEVYSRLRNRLGQMKSINQDDLNELRSLSDRLGKFEDLKRKADSIVQQYRPVHERSTGLANAPSELEREEAKLIQSTLDFAVIRVSQLRERLRQLIGKSTGDVRLPEDVLRDLNSIADKIRTRATKLDILEHRLNNDPLFNKQDIRGLCDEIRKESDIYQTLKDKLLEVGSVGRDHLALLDELNTKMAKFEDLKHHAVLIAGYRQPGVNVSESMRQEGESKYL